MSQFLPKVGQAILNYIDGCAQDLTYPGPGEDPFDGLALDLFAHQFANNRAYRSYCEGRGADPDSVKTWQDIPPVPTDAFKVAHLSTLKENEKAEALFRTSGTTQGARGVHTVADLSYYHRAMGPTFSHFLLPENQRLRFLNLTPDTDDSSLGHMVRGLVGALGHSTSLHFFKDGSLDLEGIWAALKQAEAEGVPVLILGTAFAYVWLLDHKDRATIKLPPGSRLMETGGFKGRSRVVSRHDLRSSLSNALGLPPHALVGEYGMTELSSQLYERSFRNHTQKLPPSEGYFAPPWVKVRILDPLSFEARSFGESGVICIYDLANVNSVSMVLTSDIGRLLPGGGLLLMGRAEGSDARGCSLRVEEMMLAQEQKV